MKWIRAEDLERWADTIDSRTNLSELVSAMVRASAADISSFRFPTGDSAQLPGYDGALDAKGVPPYVPDGKSVWEFGTDADYVKKANADYKARSGNPDVESLKQTAFVFVTPRRWKRDKPSLQEWQDEREAEGKWKAVKIIDGIGLEDWLERCPAVAAWAARQILWVIPELGVQSTDEFWEEYASRFKPAANERVLLCDRDEQAMELREGLSGPPRDLLYQADSEDEVLAFVIAAIRSADHEKRRFFEARTLVIDSQEAARQLARQPNLIFLPRGSALSLCGLLASHNPTVVPSAREGGELKGVTTLKRPTRRALSEALATAGLNEDRANKIAARCGRSVTILARQIPSGFAPKPAWDGETDLLPALLLGSWNSGSPADREVVTRISGAQTYEDYEGVLRTYLKFPDLFEHEGGVWKVRAPVELFTRLGYLISRDHLRRIEEAFTDVFSERDPALDLPAGERMYAGLHGKALKHSEWLRNGLATTLLFLAVLYDAADLDVPEGAQAFADRLVEQIPGLNQDWRALASLGRQLPLLAEAAPRPILSALEELASGTGAAIRPIFQDIESASFTGSPHTELLWALELLAWDPSFISRAALVLANLARIDPGGKMANRPLASLVEIFLAWHPQTNATLGQRLGALNHTLRHEPEVGWKLILALLPTFHSVLMPTVQPRYRDAGESEKEPLTGESVSRMFGEFMRRAIDMAGDKPERWNNLLKAMPNFGPAYFPIACDRLEQFLARADADQRAVMWPALRNLVNQHKAFPDAKWVMSDPDLKRLELIADSVKPSDPVTRIAWLFDTPYPHLPDVDASGRVEAFDKAREAGVRELYGSGGFTAILALAKAVNHPGYVAAALRPIMGDPAEYDSLIDQTVGQGEKLNQFAAVLSWEADRKFGAAWRERILIRQRSGRFSPADLVTLVLLWEDERKTWEFVGSMGIETESDYWKRKAPWPLRGDTESLVLAARNYLKARRAIPAIGALYARADDLPAEAIFQMLDKAIEEFSSPAFQPSSQCTYELGTMFESLRKRANVPAVEVARREYAYLPLLYHTEGSLTLHSLMAESPSFFVEVLCDAFKPATGDAPEPTKERHARGMASYRLLSTFTLVPGQQNGAVDAGALRAWVTNVRQIASQADRAVIADQFIGRVLAHIPGGADGNWPPRVICELLEELESEDVERGIEVERFNMRGVFTKAVYEGGGQERGLAQQARAWARAAESYPRTSAMLFEIAHTWDADANREDQRARHDEMRFE